MRIAGQASLDAPVDEVWDALLDPAVLVRTIPGCERLEVTGENRYAMTVTAGVAAIKGTYAGTCALSDLDPHRSLRLVAEGQGAPGTFRADVEVRFTDHGDGTTGIGYDADTVVGGMIGGVGQRMLGSVSRRLAAEFFGSVEEAIRTPVAAAAPVGAAAPEAAAGEPMPWVYRDLARPGRAPGGPGFGVGFGAGVAVGAGLVALGVVLGAAAGRRG